MIRIMKYELIRNKFRYLMMAVVMGLVELAFIIANSLSLKYSIVMGIVFFLVAFGTLFIVIFEGDASYNRDLREKSGYMVFMTPLPAWQILLGKIIVILMIGIALFAGYCFLGYADLHLLSGAMKRDNADSQMILLVSNILDQFYSMDAVILLLKCLVYLICFVTLIVTLSYLASTMSASILRGRKGEKVIAFILVVVLLGVVAYISSKITNGSDGLQMGFYTDGLVFRLSNDPLRSALSVVFQLACSIAAFLASSYLLDKKVDL